MYVDSLPMTINDKDLSKGKTLMELTEEDLIQVREKYGDETFKLIMESRKERNTELRKVKIENILNRQ